MSPNHSQYHVQTHQINTFNCQYSYRMLLTSMHYYTYGGKHLADQFSGEVSFKFMDI